MLLIRFIIIAICVLYIIRSLARIFLPMLFQNMVNKAQQQYNNQQQNPFQQQQQRQNRPEGKVKIDHAPPTKSQIPDNEGDFVDFEEVK